MSSQQPRMSKHDLVPANIMELMDIYFEKFPESKTNLEKDGIKTQNIVKELVMLRNFARNTLKQIYSKGYSNGLVNTHFPNPEINIEDSYMIVSDYFTVKKRNI